MMISVWHLLWIVPLAGSVGFMTCALLSMNTKTNNNNFYSEKSDA